MSDLVCHCFQVTEAELREILATKPISSLDDLQDHTHAGRGCGCCVFDLDDLIDEYTDTTNSQANNTQ